MITRTEKSGLECIHSRFSLFVLKMKSVKEGENQSI